MNLLKTSFKRPDDDDLQPVIRFDANVYDEPENVVNGTTDEVKEEEQQPAYGNLSFNYSRVKDEESGIDGVPNHGPFHVDVHHLARTAKRSASEAGDMFTSFYDTNRVWLKPLLLGIVILLVLVGLVLLIVLTQTGSSDSPSEASGLMQLSEPVRRTSTPRWNTLKWNSITPRKATVVPRGSFSKAWHNRERLIPDSLAFHSLQCQYTTDLKCQLVQTGHLGCLSSTKQCDGKKDCMDGADEYHCCRNTERQGEFACNPIKRCVNVTLLCDGFHDCPNGADESEDLCSYRKSACPSDEFECIVDGLCIKSEERCDRRQNCHDGSDEKDCMYLCPSGMEICEHATVGEAEKVHPFCVSRERLCDSTWDCDTGNDEDVEICSETQPTEQCKAGDFQCGDGLCIPKKERCDRRFDCDDGSDERGCEYQCPDDSFVLCGDTTHEGDDHPFCVPKEKICDGEWHCTDGADENSTFCQQFATTARDNKLTLTSADPRLGEPNAMTSAQRSTSGVTTREYATYTRPALLKSPSQTSSASSDKESGTTKVGQSPTETAGHLQGFTMYPSNRTD